MLQETNTLAHALLGYLNYNKRVLKGFRYLEGICSQLLPLADHNDYVMVEQALHRVHSLLTDESLLIYLLTSRSAEEWDMQFSEALEHLSVALRTVTELIGLDKVIEALAADEGSQVQDLLREDGSLTEQQDTPDPETIHAIKKAGGLL